MASWFTPRLRRRAALAVGAALLLPWALGQFAKGFHEPGLDNDALRHQLLIDFWVTGVMKGPRHQADGFPGAPGEPPP